MAGNRLLDSEMISAVSQLLNVPQKHIFISGLPGFNISPNRNVYLPGNWRLSIGEKNVNKAEKSIALLFSSIFTPLGMQ